MKPFIDQIVKNDLQTLHTEVAADEFVGKMFLITGGAGFLGSWLCDFLIEGDGMVECVDDLSTGMNANIDHLSNQKKFQLGSPP